MAKGVDNVVIDIRPEGGAGEEHYAALAGKLRGAREKGKEPGGVSRMKAQPHIHQTKASCRITPALCGESSPIGGGRHCIHPTCRRWRGLHQKSNCGYKACCMLSPNARRNADIRPNNSSSWIRRLARGDSRYTCPRCLQRLSHNFRKDMQERRCTCFYGATLTTNVNPAWETPLQIASGALLPACRTMFYQPRRTSSVAESDSAPSRARVPIQQWRRSGPPNP